MSGTVSHSAVVWLDGAQLDLARRVARSANLDVVAAGSAQRGRASELATAFDCRAAADLRAEIAALVAAGGSRAADVLWLLAPGDFASDPASDDGRALAAAVGAGVRVVVGEPRPASLQMAGAMWPEGRPALGPPGAPRFAPLIRHSDPFREAAEALASFGAPRTVAVQCWSRAHEATLSASLYAALDVVLDLLGEPERVDAGVTAPTDAGLELHTLRGDLAAHLRFAGGRFATLTLSDQAAGWDRSVTVLGERGRVHLWDDGFEWRGPDGTVLDCMETPRAEGENYDLASDVIAKALTRAISRAPTDAPPEDPVAVLACAHACLLSARTGQSESPSTVRRIALGG